MKLVLLISLVLILPFVFAGSLEIYCASQGSMDSCLLKIAQDKKDPDYCKDIGSLGTRNSCYKNLAGILDDKELCSKIKKEGGSYEDVYECYEDYIESPEDISLCVNEIKSGEYHDKCVGDVVGLSGDYNLCVLIEDLGDRIDCYVNVAEDTLNEKVCSMISANINSKECKDQNIEECETDESVQKQIDECKNKVLSKNLLDECRSYKKSMEKKLSESEQSEFLFKRDNPEKETFSVDVKSINLQSNFVIIELNANSKKARYTVFPGQTIKHEFLNLILLDLYDHDSKPTARFCFYKNKEITLEPEIEASQEPEIKEPEILIAEEGEYEIIDNVVPVKQKVKLKKGFIRRSLSWFWSLFGFNQS